MTGWGPPLCVAPERREGVAPADLTPSQYATGG